MNGIEEEGGTRRLSTGLIRAMGRQSVKSSCDGCNFPMPVYPGRYPKTCPFCGSERPAIESKEGGNGTRKATD